MTTYQKPSKPPLPRQRESFSNFTRHVCIHPSISPRPKSTLTLSIDCKKGLEYFLSYRRNCLLYDDLFIFPLISKWWHILSPGVYPGDKGEPIKWSTANHFPSKTKESQFQHISLAICCHGGMREVRLTHFSLNHSSHVFAGEYPRRRLPYITTLYSRVCDNRYRPTDRYVWYWEGLFVLYSIVPEQEMVYDSEGIVVSNVICKNRG